MLQKIRIQLVLAETEIFYKSQICTTFFFCEDFHVVKSELFMLSELVSLTRNELIHDLAAFQMNRFDFGSQFKANFNNQFVGLLCGGNK